MPGASAHSHDAGGWGSYKVGTSSRWHHERVPHLSQFLGPPRSPPAQWGDPPPIHTWRIPSSKGEHARSPGSTHRHTHTALIPPPATQTPQWGATCITRAYNRPALHGGIDQRGRSQYQKNRLLKLSLLRCQG